MSHLSDPDRLERFAKYVLADDVTPLELAEALNDAAERIRSHQDDTVLASLMRSIINSGSGSNAVDFGHEWGIAFIDVQTRLNITDRELSAVVSAERPS